MYACTALSGIYYRGPSWQQGNCIPIITTDITGHNKFLQCHRKLAPLSWWLKCISQMSLKLGHKPVTSNIRVYLATQPPCIDDYIQLLLIYYSGLLYSTNTEPILTIHVYFISVRISYSEITQYMYLYMYKTINILHKKNRSIQYVACWNMFGSHVTCSSRRLSYDLIIDMYVLLKRQHFSRLDISTISDHLRKHYNAFKSAFYTKVALVLQ